MGAVDRENERPETRLTKDCGDEGGEQIFDERGDDGANAPPITSHGKVKYVSAREKWPGSP